MVLGYLVQDLVAYFYRFSGWHFFPRVHRPWSADETFRDSVYCLWHRNNTLRDQDPTAATAKPLMAPCQRNHTEF
jgi:hypothetical protein